MPKQQFCSACGIELTTYPKAIPGKGRIVHLVDPHECEGFAIEEKPEGKETVLEIIKGLKPLGQSISDSQRRGERTNLIIGKDLRNDKDKKTTTAPSGLIDQIQHMEPE